MKRISVLLASIAFFAFSCGTDLDLPQVQTNDVTNIGFSSALVSGEVISQGSTEVLSKGICWSTSSNPSVSGTRSDNGAGIGSFTSSITNLQPNTTYHVRAYATNTDGTSYGADITFTTMAK